MRIRRPDTPLAATVFGNVQEPKQTPQQRRDSIAGARKAEIAKKRADLDAILAKKRAEATAKKAKSDSLQKVRVDQFAQRAESLGLTPAQYSKKLEKQNRKSDVPSSTPDYKQRSGINPCPGNLCKK